MPRYKWVQPHIPDVEKLVAAPVFQPKTAEGLQHGRHIFLWKHMRTRQILYTFEPVLQDSHLKQLPFIGKKSVPASIRPDLWRPYCTVTFPTQEQGRYTYRRLSELLRLHYQGWDHTKVFDAMSRKAQNILDREKKRKEIARMKRRLKREMEEGMSKLQAQGKNVVDASKSKEPEDGGEMEEAVDAGRLKEAENTGEMKEVVGAGEFKEAVDASELEEAQDATESKEAEDANKWKLPPMTERKKRMNKLMNQSENVVADLAHVLISQSERASELEQTIVFRKLQQEHIFKTRLEEINTLAKEAEDGAIQRLEKEISETKDKISQETSEESKVKLNESILLHRRRIKHMLWAQRQAAAYLEAQKTVDKVTAIDEQLARLKEEESNLTAQDQGFETSKAKQVQLIADIKLGLSLKFRRYRNTMLKHRYEDGYQRDQAEDQVELQQLAQELDRLEKLQEITEMQLWRLKRLSEHPVKDHNFLNALATGRWEKAQEAWETRPSKNNGFGDLTKYFVEKTRLEARKIKWMEGRQRLLELLSMEKDLPDGEILEDRLQKELLELQNRNLEPSIWKRNMHWQVALERRQELINKKNGLPKGMKLPYRKEKELQMLMAKEEPEAAEWDANLERRLLELSETNAPARIEVQLELFKVQKQISKLESQRRRLTPGPQAQDQIHPSLLNPVARSLVPKRHLKPWPKPFTLEGVALEWADAAAWEVAEKWPDEVGHRHLGVSKRDRRIRTLSAGGVIPQFPRNEEELMDQLMQMAPHVEEEYVKPARNMPEVKEVQPPPPPQKTGIWKYLPTFQNRFARTSATV